MPRAIDGDDDDTGWRAAAARLLGLSPQSYMFRRWQQLHVNDDSDDLCWLAASTTMNPLLPQHIIDKAMADDPARARGEYSDGLYRRRSSPRTSYH